jgi:hypothetical protein
LLGGFLINLIDLHEAILRTLFEVEVATLYHYHLPQAKGWNPNSTIGALKLSGLLHEGYENI